MKDNFSIQSENYANFRPTYPDELYNFLLPLIKSRNAAWDCGTGNGQVASALSAYFDNVYATDISENQLKHAHQKHNIFYSLAPAEKTSFTDNIFDLVTVAQAIHWFNFDVFYKEVRRTIKPGGVFAMIGYGLITLNPLTDAIINHFYYNIIHPWWDKERKYVEDNYATIPLPFNEIKSPQLKIPFTWSLEQLVGYLNTWSAVQHFIKANNSSPVDSIYPQLHELFAIDKKQEGHFPVLLRTAIVNKPSEKI